jgi:hypothetical protein
MPALEHPAEIATYRPDGWGPKQADDLIAPRHWHLH